MYAKWSVAGMVLVRVEMVFCECWVIAVLMHRLGSFAVAGVGSNRKRPLNPP